MTDFFTNLVARSLGTSPALHPRLPSLFEPVGDDSKFVDILSIPAGETFQTANHDSNGERPARRSARLPSQAPSTAEQDARVGHENGRVLDTNNKPADRHHSHQVVHDISDPSRPSAQIEPPQSDELSSHVIDDSQRPINESGVELEFPEPEVRARPANSSPFREVTDLNITPAPREEREQASRLRTTTEDWAVGRDVEKAAENSSAVIPAKVPFLSQFAASVSPTAHAPRDSHTQFNYSQQAEPNVQVTIGRVEIRATKERTPSVRREARSPVMSLEEYLRGRARRGNG
jgi:hypothetical protein